MLSRHQYESPSSDERESDLTWYQGSSSSGGPSDVTDAPKPSARRAKRVIPDEEKDDKYWARRMRNNMAAKRSRENKRLMELDIRKKSNYLEEQNALLMKEVFVIKTRYGLPLDRSILSPEEQAQCMQEVKNAQALESQAFKIDQTEDKVNSPSPGMYPVSMAPVSHGDNANLNGRCVPFTRSDMFHGKGLLDSQGKLLIKEELAANLCSEPGKFAQKGAHVYGQFGAAVLWGALHQPGTGLHEGYPSTGLAQQQTPQQPQHNQQQHHHLHVNGYGSEGSQGGHSRPLSVTSSPPSSTPSPCGHSCYNPPLTVATDSPTNTVGTVNGVITTTTASAAANNNNNNNSSHYNDALSAYDFIMSAAYPGGQSGYAVGSGRPTMLASPSLADLSALGRGSKLLRQDAMGKTVKKAGLQETSMNLRGLPLGLDLGASRHEGYGVMSGVAAQAQINIASSFRSAYGYEAGGGTMRDLQEAKAREKLHAQSVDDVRMRVLSLAAHMEQTRKLAINK